MAINITDLRENLYKQIVKTDSAKDIFDLFKMLNYPNKVVLNTSYKRRKNTFEFRKEDEEKIREIYSILTFEEKLPLFLLETTSLAPSFLRSITSTFDKQYLQFLMIVTIDYSEMVFILPDREKIDAGKHKLRLIKLVINKEDMANKKEYYSVIETLANIYYENEANWRDVWRKWRKAFSVKRVTEDFFSDYSSIFFTIRKELNKQGLTSKEAHEFTLQLLNRIMFIYFISKKKGWLEQPKFIGWLWDSYKRRGKSNSNEFYDKWLRQVFFKAFNNRSNELEGLPDNVVKTISGLPYLNGGLFRENSVDELKVAISDKMFHDIFDFFEKYNFTIREDMPLDSEVAVDPQMLGYVYESLANVAEEIYDMNDLGIFYTPRVEVDFMCRRSLVEFLYKHLPDIPKEKFYHLIFDLPEEKEEIITWFNKQNLWFRLKEVLDDLSVVDPACGSGAFLVGMLNILAELYKLIYANTSMSISDFSIKNRVIQYSLYGVDVMPWAIHTAELRLWLQLIVETEFKKEELRKNILLPNLNLNLRVGDSLVQEVSGLTFNLRTNNLDPSLKKKLETLKQEKRKYFENSSTRLFKTVDEVKAEEIRLFEEILEERKVVLDSNIGAYTLGIKKAKLQKNLSGAYNIDESKIAEYRSKINNTTQELEKLKKLKIALKDPEKKPFVWDIDFAEIFGDKGGFDIVIGNPPYVRQENISPPNKLKAEVNVEDKKQYKEKLIISVKDLFQELYNLDKRSDYYVYFYFHGLGLLNEKGTFCFITSNSWLDVDYGKELQEFLCKYVPITAIYDSTKRSFAHADVNTIIALFGAPTFEEGTLHGLRVVSNKWPMLENTSRFIMFKKPFEEGLTTKNLIDIEGIDAKINGKDITELVNNIVNTNDYRVFPIVQGDLLNDGWGYPDRYQNSRFRTGSYEGNKWGSKYLRAPDIFFTILKKGQGKLVKLDDIAEVRFGIKSGVNNFFYFESIGEPSDKKCIKVRNLAGWEGEIEKEFLQPVIKSPRECDSIIINPIELKYKIFMCHKTKTELKGTHALKYIEWGEQQKTEKGMPWNNVPSVKGRKNWYDVGEWTVVPLFWIETIGDTFKVHLNDGVYETDKFYGIEPTKIKRDSLINLMNSTIIILQKEMSGFKSLGGGALKTPVYEVKSLLIPLIELKRGSINLKRKINPIMVECGFDVSKPIREQEPKPLGDREELDNIIFDGLGLTKDERREVYWATCELVKQRLEKAKSLKDL